MLNLEELKHFIAFAEYGTLSKAAEQLHISQPTLTRSMQNIEMAFDVPIFERSKNRIWLNNTGKLALEQARRLLDTADDSIKIVRAYHKSLKTIRIESCAPAPLWTLIPVLSDKNPSMSITSELVDMEKIIADTICGDTELGIITKEIKEEGIRINKYCEEHLSICLPPDHPIVQTGKKEVKFEDINGYNCLLRSEIGFWAELCYEKMPASRFLIQKDNFSFEELVRSTTLPYFTTNLVRYAQEPMKAAVALPIIDTEANVTYYLIAKQTSHYF